MTDMLFRGELHCTTCKREGRPKVMARDLYYTEDGSYIAYCFKHRPPERLRDENCRLMNYPLSFPWAEVVSITLHKPEQECGNYKGKIITVEMRAVQNVELMRFYSVQVCQALMLMAYRRCVIHSLGEPGEQNHCFVETNYRWESPAACTIVDKYWSIDQINIFHDVCRLMARIHKWKRVDETQSLLDRIVEAIDEQ